ncbi:cupin domain-containing protein [Novosphingobium sp. CCH12-A3]|uniref:cupin domain-containing protein n=1 Tax=Novosphingobium sp. CCH12-A3 TaxID=1768752 RepID=UPI000783FB34|nr:cupin domain-containing protein [Novosphingobium sp. CCH12-A3]
MSDPFASASPGMIPLPQSGTAFVRAGGDWRQSAPGFFEIPVLDDGATGLRTVVMKMEPGAYSPPHSHDHLEQIFVIQGEFYDADRHYGAGDFLVRLAGTPHIAGTREGATMLVTYIPQKKASEGVA